MEKSIILIFLFFTAFIAIAQSDYQIGIQQERDSINLVFGNSEESILNEADLKDFQGIPFYSIDEKYRVKFYFRAINDGKEFEMKTTTSRLPVYKPYGELIFKIDDQSYTLTVFQSMDMLNTTGYEDYLFIPFTDKSSGEESYGGGRYIDIRIDDLYNPEFYLDFNICYNPYCAYNDRYSCPIPPSDNYIDIPILAGAKKWHD